MQMTRIQRDALARAKRGDFELADAIELEARIKHHAFAGDIVAGYRSHRLVALGEGEQEYDHCCDCDGSGEELCTACNVDGCLECPQCKGAGSVPGPLGADTECPKCAGTKEIECPECVGTHHVDCTRCDGEGDVLGVTIVHRIVDLNGRLLWDEGGGGRGRAGPAHHGRPRMGRVRHPRIPRRRRRRGHHHRGGRLMRATVNAADLAAALKQSVSASTTTMPVLQHALITTAPEALVIETSDSEVTVRTQVPAQVEQEGSQLLRADLLHPVAAVDGEVLIRKDGHLNRGRSRFVIPARLPAEWPGLEAVDWHPMQVDVAELAAAMDVVAYAADEDDMRVYLRGLNIVPGWAWCADSASMALCRLDYDGPGVNVPKRQVKRVREMVVDGAQIFVGNVHGKGAGMLRVDAGRSQLFVVLAEASGLDVTGVARALHSEREPATLDRAGLAATLRRFLPFAHVGGGTGRSAITVVSIEATGDDLTLADKAGQNIESIGHLLHESTPVEGLGTWRAGVDARRLIQVVGAIPTSRIDLYRPAGEGSGNRVWTILPADAKADDLAHYISRFDL